MSRVEQFPYAEELAQSINRRGLLRTAAAGLMAVVGGEWLGAWFEPRHAADVVAAPPMTQLAVGDAVAAKSTQLGAEVLIVRVDSETVVAFDRRCPHLGCPVLWSPQHARFECPCHQATFDGRTGAVLSGPPRRGLTPVSVRLSENNASLARAKSGTAEG